MVMIANTLAAELEKMAPTTVEVDAAAALSAAYEVFAKDAMGSGVPILPAGPAAGRVAMFAALSGMSATGAGAAIMSSAIILFWATSAPLGWPPPMIAVPPPNAGLAAALPLVLAANTAGGLSIKDAMLAIATAMYTQAIIGGTVAIPPAGPLPIL